MTTLPNLLSFSRIPLAFIFFQSNPFYRSIAIFLALLTDGLDGYLARRYQQISTVGTLLDPVADKFFVLMAGVILVSEGQLSVVEICMLLCRDFSVLIFGCYLLIKGLLPKYRFRAILSGKVTTVLQLIVLFSLVWGVVIPSAAFFAFVVLGVLALVELYCSPLHQESS